MAKDGREMNNKRRIRVREKEEFGNGLSGVKTEV